MRGVSFEIPNTYGKYLFEILDGSQIREFIWRVIDVESYRIENKTLGEPLFPATCIVDGEKLYREISKDDQYLIFVDLKAFPNEADVKEITTYQEFVDSECQFVLLVVDSSYVTIYAKDQMTIKQLHAKAVTAGYKNIVYITDDNDEQKSLIAF